MKSLKESIFDDIEDIASNDTVLIEQFLKDNYDICGTYNIDGNVVNVDGYVDVKNKDLEALTNGIFRFGKVSGSFWADHCTKLKSLEGSPREVGMRFSCYECRNLVSLEGAPEKVDKDFECAVCTKLKSLEGAPEKVGGKFDYSGCKNLRLTDQDREKYGI